MAFGFRLSIGPLMPKKKKEKKNYPGLVNKRGRLCTELEQGELVKCFKIQKSVTTSRVKCITPITNEKLITGKNNNWHIWITDAAKIRKGEMHHKKVVCNRKMIKFQIL
uniref:Uncharacterized protein n=1 Tax=Rhizophora mucronata TaxID=61149 RepID=A0A2P2IIP2_RHIMU